MDTLKPTESIRLNLRDEDPAATTWRAIPDLVALNPAEDGRSCWATPRAGASGRITVKAIAADRRCVVGLFILEIEGEGGSSS